VNLLGNNGSGLLVTTGDLQGGSIAFMADGIGEDDESILTSVKAYATYSFSKTDPKHSAGMLGTTSSTETGTSYYVGFNVPGFMDEDRIGIEYNHGSKYWRSFTYGEDTLVGSKLSTRGDAYELYYNIPLVGDYLTAQLRYTYISYDYTGSDMFFGSTGTPLTKEEAAAQGMGFVDSASNIRLSMRYRY